ncbi:YkgJ family cysteine cluster protein [Desulfosediminicola flagellatus]|uniref:YkgJ family cysteine cluster protein n=1 Tax=Desulfosediminicola flagellatus TaxID=2569541 RepID=UPI0010AD84C4|nr:YkgJ family cysteine cluster protein [Desulfosediminicola flagellatus]
MQEHKQSYPSPDEKISREYKALLSDVDTRVNQLVDHRFKLTLQCRPGCSDCCMEFSVLPLEAAHIIQQLKFLKLEKQSVEAKCVMLEDDLCRVYEIRPVICRTQGMPVAYVDEMAATIEVSACQLNFPDDYPLEHDDLLMMDQFNSRLAELNLQYCKNNNINPERRVPLAELV